MIKIRNLNYSFYLCSYLATVSGCTQINGDFNMMNKEKTLDTEASLDSSSGHIGAIRGISNLGENVDEKTFLTKAQNCLFYSNAGTLSGKKTLLWGLLAAGSSFVGGGWTAYEVMNARSKASNNLGNDGPDLLARDAVNVTSTSSTCPTDLRTCMNNFNTSSAQMIIHAGYAAGNRTGWFNCNNTYSILNTTHNTMVSQNNICLGNLNLATISRDNCLSDLNSLRLKYNAMGSNCTDTVLSQNASLSTCNTDKNALQATLTTTQNSLNTCNNNYTTLNQNHNDCTSDLATKTAALQISDNSLSACNSDKGICLTNLQTKTDDLTSTTSSYNLCLGNLNQCGTDKTTCETNLISKSNNLTDCEANYATHGSTINGLNTNITNLNTNLTDCVNRKANLTEELAITATLIAKQNYQIAQLSVGEGVSEKYLACKYALYGNPEDGTLGCSDLLNGYVDDDNVTHTGCIDEKTQALMDLLELNATYIGANITNSELNYQVSSLTTTVENQAEDIQILNNRLSGIFNSLNDEFEADHFANLEAKLDLLNSTIISLTRINFRNYYNTSYPLSITIEPLNLDLIALDQVANSLRPIGNLIVNLKSTNTSICNSVAKVDLAGYDAVSGIKISGRSYIPILGPANMDKTTKSKTNITDSIYDLAKGFYDLSSFVPCAGNASSIQSNNNPQVSISDSSSANSLLVNKIDGNYNMQFADFQNCFPDLLSGTGFLTTGKLANNITTYNEGEYLSLGNANLFLSNSIVFDIIPNMTSLKYLKMYGVSVTSDQINNALKNLGDPEDLFCIHFSNIMGSRIDVPANTILGCAPFICRDYSNSSTCNPSWQGREFLQESLLINTPFYITPTSGTDTALARIPYGVAQIATNIWYNYGVPGAIIYWANGTAFGAGYGSSCNSYSFAKNYNLTSQQCIA